MPMTKPDAAMAAHLQARIEAISSLHRDIAMLGEATDLSALARLGDGINDRLRELHPKVLREHEMMALREQLRVISEDCRRLLDNFKPFTCPYCGCPTPEGDGLVLDAWGYFHCDGEDAGEECGARLRLDDSGRAIGYINRTLEGDTQLS